MDAQDKIDALTAALRHLIDCIDAMFEVEGTGNLSRSSVGRAITPSLQKAKESLAEIEST